MGGSDELLEIFVEEASGRLTALASGLLRLEVASDPDLVTDLFREAHTIKGAAAVVGLDALSAVAHAAEDLLAEVRSGARVVTPELVDRLLAVVDGIRVLLPAVRMGTDITAEADRLGMTLRRFRSGAEPRPTPEPRPAAEPIPIPEPTPAPAPIPEPRPAAEPIPIPEPTPKPAPIPVLAREPAPIPEPTPEPAPAREGALAPAAADPLWGDTVRVPITRLDALVRLVGETAAANLRVGRLLVDHIGPSATDLDAVRELGNSLNELQEMTMRARMVPIGSILEPLRRAVRTLSRELGKHIRWEAHGLDTELDRGVLNQLGDPLLHLVRNAVDHGIETPEERRTAGKPDEAVISFHAMQLGSEVVVTVTDDGRGIDLAGVRSAAARSDPSSGGLSDEEALQLVFLPGLSTARQVTDLSGRGVGLDVVRHGVDAVRGRIEVRSQLRTGTEFRIRVPITLAVLPCLLVSCGAGRYAIPMHSVAVVQETASGEPRTWVDGRPVPVTPLASVLGLDIPSRPPRTVVVVSGPSRQAGLAVDGLVGQRDVVVKGFSALIPRNDVLAGASIEPDGSILCVLDGAGLVERSRRLAGSPAHPVAAASRRASLLVVDDALTVRELQRAILERAGYSVRTAIDGRSALAALGEAPADLVVTDVEMPGMDGFELTRVIRDTPGLAALPVIIVTSRATDEDRRKGLEAGADAYLLKRSFDQGALVTVVERLLGPRP